MLSVPYWRKHGAQLEPEIMANSDLVCANSTYLRNVASKDNPNSFYVAQGCDIFAFNPAQAFNILEDIAQISKPIIGYIGALYTLLFRFRNNRNHC
jgi:hypothetical protein